MFCSKKCKDASFKIKFLGEKNPSWSGGKKKRYCVECGSEFFFRDMPSKKEKGKFCSKGCNAKFHNKNDIRVGFKLGHGVFDGVQKGWIKIGNKPWNKNKKGFQIAWNKGKDLAGKKISYSALHYRIRKLFNKPKQCENCGKKGRYYYRKNGVKVWTIQYANLSGEYRTDFSHNDWMCLCIKCHREYDRKNKIEYSPTPLAATR